MRFDKVDSSGGHSWPVFWEQNINAVSRHKIQRHAVDAVAEASGLRPVLEDMPEVAATSVAHDFHSADAMAEVHAFVDAIGTCGLVKAGPTTVALEFGP